MPDSFERSDLPALEGDILEGEASLAAAARDWGHIVQARPRLVVRPSSAADVSAVLEFAGSKGVPVAVRGAGHSPFGQAQSDGGIVLDMSGMSTVHDGTGNELRVDAGARWQQVLSASLPRGLTPPVLTDYLELSVGGTLAVGGIGGATHRYGAQTDTVTELEVVTGGGELKRCSAENDSDLFDAVRAGLGHCGVITRATLRLRPARQRARKWKLTYDSLDDYLTDQRTAVGESRFDHLEGRLVLDDSGEWRYILEGTSYFSLPDEPDEAALLGGLSFDHESVETEDRTYHGFLDRMAESETVLRADGDWFRPHPWITVIAPDDGVADVVTETLAETGREELGDSGIVLLYPLRAETLGTPLLRKPATDIVWLFAVLRTGKPYDVTGTGRMLELNAAVAERARLVEGTVYPVNALQMTPEEWRDHFGDAWETFAAAAKKYDPKNVLAHGQRVFEAL
ncbi:FAD-binding protein [Saccharomonospora sp. NPDC006951]